MSPLSYCMSVSSSVESSPPSYCVFPTHCCGIFPPFFGVTFPLPSCSILSAFRSYVLIMIWCHFNYQVLSSHSDVVYSFHWCRLCPLMFPFDFIDDQSTLQGCLLQHNFFNFLSPLVQSHQPFGVVMSSTLWCNYFMLILFLILISFPHRLVLWCLHCTLVLCSHSALWNMCWHLGPFSFFLHPLPSSALLLLGSTVWCVNLCLPPVL